MHPDPDDIQLDVMNSEQVSSHKPLTVFLGTPPATMVIFSGIAIPEWRSTGRLIRKRVWVNFGFRAQQVIDYTATAGLAGVHNEDNKQFGFWTDAVSVVLRDDTS